VYISTVSTTVQGLSPNISSSSTQCINLQWCNQSTDFCNRWGGFCISICKQTRTL